MKKYQVYLIDDGWQKDHPELTFETRADADEYVEYELAKIEADMNTMDCLMQDNNEPEIRERASVRFGYLDGLEYKVVEIDEPDEPEKETTEQPTKTNEKMKIQIELNEDLLQALAKIKAGHNAFDCFADHEDGNDSEGIYAQAWYDGARFIMHQLVTE